MKSKIQRIGTASAALMASALTVPHIGDSPESGEVYQANANVLGGAFYSEALTGFSLGLDDDSGIDSALEFLAPAVQSSRKPEYLIEEALKDFQYDADDERASGEDYKKIGRADTMKISKLKNRGLTMVLDEEDYASSDNPEEDAVATIIKRLKRNELVRAIALLDAAAVNTARTWSTVAGKDPDQDLRLSLATGADASGRLANRVFYGELAWIYRSASHRAQDNGGGTASALFDANQAAQFAGAQEGLVNSSRYDLDGVLTKVVGNKIYSFTGISGAGRKDSSNIKRFVEKGNQFTVHRQEVSADVVHITVRHRSLTVITSTLGIRKETVAQA